VKRKIFSSLLTLVLVLSFSLVTAVPALAATAPDLGTAKSFAVLGGPAVTLTNSTVTGDVGSGFPSPGSAVTLTGSTITGGTVHEGDTVAQHAYDDFLDAYAALKAEPCDVDLTGQPLAGQFLTPGVYCFDAAVTETGGTLTLEGSSTDTWIFKIGTLGTGALTGTNFSVVMSSGETCNNNVFWWTAEAATLTDSVFIGSILAGTSITVTRGSLDGQALAKVAVTLTGATITVPTIVTVPTVPAAETLTPEADATGVALDAEVSILFDQDVTVVDLSGVTIKDSGDVAVDNVVATLGVDNRTVTIAHDDFVNAETYTVTIPAEAVKNIGDEPNAEIIWSFATATTAAQSPVDLGSAVNYAVLAGSTVTNTGATQVGGDLGLSPGVSVTGFSILNTVVEGSTSTGLIDGLGIVKGTIHIADTAIDPVESTTSAAQAQLDLTTAYNDAAGRTVGAVTVAGNLGGQTLYPGLYKSTSSLEISSGDLTLDAQGDANAVFIFQMASTLITTTGREVILTNGAKASNVYWQVGSSATLGTYSVFKGNILAYASITIATGATLGGRALAQTAVTLDTNIIAIAMPTGASAPVPAVIDINPDTLNLKSQSDKNAITVYIELPLGFDPGQISVATVELKVFGITIPALSAPTSVGDYDADGIAGRMLKFDRSAVIAALGETVGDINVTVTGKLNNGRTFAGSDTIKVVNSGK